MKLLLSACLAMIALAVVESGNYGHRRHWYEDDHYIEKTKKRIDDYLTKTHRMGKRRLQVSMKYLNTPLKFQYLNQYYNFQHPLTYTNIAPKFGMPYHGLGQRGISAPHFGNGYPGHTRSPLGSLLYGQHSYGSPVYGQHSYGSPSYGQYSYQSPSQESLSYGAPSHAQQPYGSQSYGSPAYGQQPSYGQGGQHYGQTSLHQLPQTYPSLLTTGHAAFQKPQNYVQSQRQPENQYLELQPQQLRYTGQKFRPQTYSPQYAVTEDGYDQALVGGLQYIAQRSIDQGEGFDSGYGDQGRGTAYGAEQPKLQYVPWRHGGEQV